MEHRQKDRRFYKKISDFPFLTKEGLALKERRLYVDRRTRNIQTVWFEA